MSVAEIPPDTFTKRLLWGLVSSLIIAVSICYYWGDRNPDWISYMRIFDQDGAWLSTSGRDSTFTFLIAVFRGQGFLTVSYEGFRIALAFVFAVFSIRFMSGKIIYFPISHSVFLLAPFLSFALVRCTIQVREGLSLVFFFLALKLVLPTKSLRMPVRVSRIVLAGTLFYASVTTHIAGAIVVAVLLLSFGKMKISRWIWQPVEFVLIPVGLVVLFLFALQFGAYKEAISFGESFAGDRSAVEDGISMMELVVWLLFIILNFAVSLQTLSPTSDRMRQYGVLQVFARTLAGPVAVSGGILVLFLKASLVSAVVTVLIVRTAEASSSIGAVVVSALYGRRYSVIALAAFLLLKTFSQVTSAGF